MCFTITVKEAQEALFLAIGGLQLFTLSATLRNILAPCTRRFLTCPRGKRRQACVMPCGDRVGVTPQVTTGEEGFWPQGSPRAPFNPWGSALPRNWSYGTGQDFSAQHAPDAIDFAVMHLWPDNWAILYGELREGCKA